METALSAETTLRDIFHESDTNPKGGRERFQRPLGVFAESQMAFRSDLLPEGLAPFREDAAYGKYNKVELLSLCGDVVWGPSGGRWHSPEADVWRRALRDAGWTNDICECSNAISHAAREPWRMHKKQSDAVPGHRDTAAWRGLANDAARRNLGVAEACGLWIRLWPWPEKGAEAWLAPQLRQGSKQEDGLKNLESDPCIQGGIASVTEDVACRGRVRAVSEKRFEDALDAMCTA
jgi:hypothetical protein